MHLISDFLMLAVYASACSPPAAANCCYFCCRDRGRKIEKAFERAQELEQRGIKNQLLEPLIILFDHQSWDLSFLGYTGRRKAPIVVSVFHYRSFAAALVLPLQHETLKQGVGMRVEGCKKGGQEQLRAEGVNI